MEKNKILIIEDNAPTPAIWATGCVPTDMR